MVPPPPLSLYVHLPWCVRKCPYCDFNSYTAGNAAPRRRYLDALVADLDIAARHAGSRPLVSIFLGGGTPSLFSPAEIGRLLQATRERFALADDIEITMEANPGTVECGEPGAYRAAGVNRLSLGAQSFDAQALLALGRIHSVDDISRAAGEARQAGFDNLNIDVMYALPGQDVAAALADLEAAVALEPAQLSWYQLTIEPNTVFHARPPHDLPDEETTHAIQQSGQALLERRAFEHYEVSAYAREGKRCRHNLNYWSFGDYLAVGAGAHGKISTTNGVVRYARPANPQHYMQAIESGDIALHGKPLSGQELLFEFMLNALRLTEGFDEGLFTARTGLSAELLQERFGTLVERGLIEKPAASRWRPTSLGQRFLNDLQAHFLPG